MKWIKLVVHTRKEDFVSFIHTSKENTAANKEDTTAMGLRE